MSASESINTTTNTIATSDLEWSGQINRALGQGRAFALLLSMLESDVLERPKIVSSDEENTVPDTNLKSDYRRPALRAADIDWHNALPNSQHFAHHPSDGKLFQTMHPQPLSIFNDAKRIDDEVLANCDYYTQNRLKSLSEKQIDADATQLYDILEQGDSIAATLV